MKPLTVLTLFVSLTTILSASYSPAVAQHRGAAHSAGGHAPNHPAQHPGNGGMQHVPAHIQQQIQQQQRQYLQQMQRYQQQMQQEFARQQQEAQKLYERQANQFHEYLKANGGAALQGKLSSFKTPAEFNNWANTQKQRKAQKKKYDPLYDHFRSFADSMNARDAGAGKGRNGKASLAESEKDRNEKKSREAELARKEAGKGKRDSVKHGENARRNPAQGKHLLAQDQTSVNLLRTVHGKLREADHDYQGHRVRAMHHVGEALQHLGSSAPAGLGSVTSLGSGMGFGNLPQTQSDGVLRDSLQKVRTVESQLGSRSNAAAHHSRARASLGQAIRELETALRIR